MLVQTQWQKSTIVVAPSRTQLLKYTVQSSVKIFYFSSFHVCLHICLFVCNRGKILHCHGRLWASGARTLGHSPMNESAIWNRFAWLVVLVSLSFRIQERTEPVVWNTIQMDTSIYISHKRKDFKGFMGRNSNQVMLTSPIFFFCKFSRKAFLGSTRN